MTSVGQQHPGYSTGAQCEWLKWFKKKCAGIHKSTNSWINSGWPSVISHYSLWRCYCLNPVLHTSASSMKTDITRIIPGFVSQGAHVQRWGWGWGLSSASLLGARKHSQEGSQDSPLISLAQCDCRCTPEPVSVARQRLCSDWVRTELLIPRVRRKGFLVIDLDCSETTLRS